MTREYGGTKTLETKGGSTLTNSYWKKQPNWGNGLPAWHLVRQEEQITALSVSGRRVWNLSFSYLQDSDLMPENSNLTAYETDYFDTDSREKSFLDDSANSNFFSEVLHKTVGLPFLFQPDSNNNNPDQFAICMFDQDKFQFSKITDSMYNVSMTIREVW